MDKAIYKQLIKARSSGQKQLAVLLDPDKLDEDDVLRFSELIKDNTVDFVFVGGSLLTNEFMGLCIKILKETLEVPVVIFPGSPAQVYPNADGILLLSLISGRNPELLIGSHVQAAPLLKKSSLEIIPTGYMLVESGKLTSVAYISNTLPIPSDKLDIAVCTAMAGEMLGLKVIYLDAGSGAIHPVPEAMITAVKNSISLPLITGGGIRNSHDAALAWQAGADLLVVGNALEKDPNFVASLCFTRDHLNKVRV